MKTFKEYIKESFDNKDVKYFNDTMKNIERSYFLVVSDMDELVHTTSEESDYDVANAVNMALKAIESFDNGYARAKKALENLLRKAQGK